MQAGFLVPLFRAFEGIRIPLLTAIDEKLSAIIPALRSFVRDSQTIHRDLPLLQTCRYASE